MSCVAKIKQHEVDDYDIRIAGHEPYDFTRIREDSTSLLDHLDNGAKPYGLLMTPKIVKERKYILDAITVGGRSCKTPKAIKHLCHGLKFSVS